MPSTDFFPERPAACPIIYAYEEPKNPQLKGLLKVGYTSRTIDERMREHYPTLKPGETPYRVVFTKPAMRTDGTIFRDHEIHVNLEANRIRRMRDRTGKLTEWFRCSPRDVEAAYISVLDRVGNIERRTRNFSMRPEQVAAVRKTEEYFREIAAESSHRTPKFLWNAKMRFGKTFAAYQLARRMGFKRVLVLTFKPAVLAAWEEDLLTHMDFEGWQFVSRQKNPGAPDIAAQYERADKRRPIVCFGSFQDFMGRDSRTGSIKAHHEWVRQEDWDLVVFDEYHFGAWNENSKKLFEQETEDERDTRETDDTSLGHANTGNEVNEGDLPIVTRFYLFLSGTPFRALNSGEFIEEQIYNWTYSDEQAAKAAWPAQHPDLPNPYESLPRMVMLTYQMPEEIKKVALGGEYNGFDLNAFFEAEGEGDAAEFVLKDYVQKWLDLIRGAYSPVTTDNLRLGTERPALPYSDTRLLRVLNHTLWYLPRVNSCYAMRNLLREPQNAFFHDYTVNVCAGTEAGVGMAALDKVRETMNDPLHSQTITLTCGKLTTGVTVKPWCGIFMLTNMRSPESYFQAAFRVQSPWTAEDDAGAVQIIKRECYVFDFALDRALRMVSDYSCRLKVDENAGPEQKVGEFINFLPVLAYDGSTMQRVSAADILDMAMAGTSATLLARRWESALLVNVDNDTLRRILDSEEAMRAIMSIEGFRALGGDIIETIVNKSEAMKRIKREAADDDGLSPKEKNQLSDEEKEYKSKRKQVQEKLIKFATRIPVFMYLTDYREETLKDVITQLEPKLFKKVTGLAVTDFELLVSLGVFNDALMNDAVYKFRRYENASLEYAGVNRHANERIGLFDTSLSQYDLMAMEQEESTIAPDGLLRRDGRRSAADRNGVRAAASRCSTGGKRLDNSTGANGSGGLTGAAKEKIASSMGLTTIPPEPAAKPAQHDVCDENPQFEQVEEAFPSISEEDLAALEPGVCIFHKAFGYGKVLEIRETLIKVHFTSDDRKKDRLFGFPSAFHQGLLQLG